MAVISTNAIRKEFGTLVAVNDVSLSLEKGQVLGLIGPNGAGKTTLLRMLATLLNPTRGSATILDHDLVEDALEIRNHLGFLPDFFNLYNDLTPEECLEFFARSYKVSPAKIPQCIEDSLTFVGLTDKRQSLIKHLSRGMVQRLGVASLMVHSPELFILDEPASGLDPGARVQLREILIRLSEEGKTVIISSHILSELAEFCTHIAIMNEGRLHLFGSVDEIQAEMASTRKAVIAVVGDSARVEALIQERGVNQILSVHHGIITIELNDGEAELAAINTWLVGQGIQISGLQVEKTSLEDLFMKISAENGSHETQEAPHAD